MAYAGAYTGAQVDEGIRKGLQLPEIKGEVANFAALPGSPTTADIYLAIAPQGVYLVNRKPAGFYRYSGSAWEFMGTSIASIGTEVLDEDNMASDSATAIATQQSIKAYADTKEPAKGVDDNFVTDAEKTVIGNTSGTNTGDEVSASPTIAGVSELATIAEIDTGTDTARTITPAGLAGSALQTKVDGVEALADVTDTSNVTAAGALMDSELTAIASVKALDQGVATTDSPQFAGLNVGHATDTTLTRVSAGLAAIEGKTIQTVDDVFYEEIFIPAGAFAPRTTNGAEAATEEYATNDVILDQYLFDSTTEEGIQAQFALPDSWDRSTIKVKHVWDAATGATAADGVTWGLSVRAVTNDDAIDAAFAASVDTDDTVTAVGDLHMTAASTAVTVSGTPALGDVLLWEVTRVVGDANDDMAEDAKYLGLWVQMGRVISNSTQW